MQSLLAYLPMLLATIAIELAVVALLSRRCRRKTLLAAALCLNLFTHPMATLLQWHLWTPYWSLELGVVLAEMLGYMMIARLSPLRALGLAILCNLASAVTAVLW